MCVLGFEFFPQYSFFVRGFVCLGGAVSHNHQNTSKYAFLCVMNPENMQVSLFFGVC